MTLLRFFLWLCQGMEGSENYPSPDVENTQHAPKGPLPVTRPPGTGPGMGRRHNWTGPRQWVLLGAF